MYLVSVKGPDCPVRDFDLQGRLPRKIYENVTFGREVWADCGAFVSQQFRLIRAGWVMSTTAPLFGLFGGGT